MISLPRHRSQDARGRQVRQAPGHRHDHQVTQCRRRPAPGAKLGCSGNDVGVGKVVEAYLWTIK
jgi:hypothetical protein